jgi:hypothetical protein
MGKTLVKGIVLAIAVLLGAAEVMAQTTWAVKNSGDWSVASNWTTDKSGQSYINPEGKIPTAEDNIIIPAGREIVYNGTDSLKVVNMTVEGQLTIANEGVAVQGTAIDGSGVVKVPSTKGVSFENITSFKGTWEVTHSNTMGDMVLSSVVISGGTQILEGDLTIMGDVVIKNGATVIFGPGIKVSVKNLTVESGGTLTSSGGTGDGQESELHITGDFINRGEVTFCDGNRTDDNNNKSKRVVLYFEGNEDGEFSAEGATTLYRLVCRKSITATQSVVAPGGIAMLGRTVDMGSYKNLPWVPESGILKLGDGVEIEHWAEVYRFFQTSKYADAGNMYIPENATLWIAGATIRTGVHEYLEGNNSGWGVEWSDGVEDKFSGNDRTIYRVGSVLIAGTLKITSGSLIQEDCSAGMYFVKSLYGEETNNVSSNLLIDGGVIETNHIVCWSENKNEASRLAVYNQTGGEVRLNKKICYNSNDFGVMSQSLYLGSGSKFIMSGGSINISVPIPSGAGNALRGIYMADFNKLPIESNVSGGEIKIFGSDIDLFEIYMPFNLNNLTVSDGAKVEMKVVGGMSQYSTLMLNGDLSVLGSSTFTTVYDVNLGGNLTIDANATFTAKSGDISLSTLTLNGSSDAIYTDLSGTLKWSNVTVSKENATVSVADGSKIQLTNSLSGLSGTLNGDVEFVEGYAQTISSSNNSLSGVNLLINKTGGSISLNGDVALNSVKFEGAYLFNLGSSNLTLNEYPTSNVGWGGNTCFTTNNSHTAGGLTLPVPTEVSEANIFPMGYNGNYIPVQPLYTWSEEGQKLTVVPVYANHPNAKETVNQPYLRIFSDVKENGGYKSTATTTSLMVKTDGEWKKVSDVTLENGTSVTFNGYTSGDFVFGNESAFSGSKTYVSANSGNWNDNIWQIDGSDELVAGSNITQNDNVIISAGNTVATNNTMTINASDIKIERGENSVGKLLVKGVGAYNILSISGNGVLEYEFNSNYFCYNVDYKAFCSQEQAEIVYNVGNNDISVWSGNFLKEYPNLTICGNKKLYLQEQSSTLIINGDLTLKSDLTIECYGGISQVGGSIIIEKDKNLVLAYHNKGKFLINQNVINNGKMSSYDDMRFYIHGSIENNGEISIPSSLVVFDGEQGLGSEMCRIYGTSSEFGKTIFGYLSIVKCFEDCRLRLDIPVGDSNGFCKVEIVKGKLHLNYNSNIVTTYQGHEEFYGWDKNNSTHPIINDFLIPETCELIVDNGCKLRLWCPSAVAPDCHRVQLSGGLKLLNGAEVSVNNATSGLDRDNEYSGFAYTSSAKSKLYMGAGTKLTAAFLTSYSSDASIDVEMVSDATINIVPSSAVYGSYGAFDVRGGRVSMSDKTIVNINNKSSVFSTYPSLYYNPVTSNVGKAQFNIQTDADPFIISAFMPLGSLNVERAAKVKLLENKLALGGNFVVAGTFDAAGEDVEIGGDMTVTDTYTPSANTTRFTNATEKQTLTAQNGLTLYGFESSAMKLNVNNAVTVEEHFAVTGGEVALAADMTLKGDVFVEYKSAVTGQNLLLNGDKQQVFDCEGSVDNLTINNSNDVISTRQQANPIVIGKSLTLTNGVFSIGGNLLEMKDGASIRGENFSNTRMVATYNSPTDRGIRFCMSAGKSYNMLLPFGESTKYTPIQLNDLKSSTTGTMTFVPNNDIEPSVAEKADANYLKFYWTVKAANVNVTAGSFVCQGLKSDAIGDLTQYKPSFLNISSGEWSAGEAADVAVENDYINITFTPRGSQTDVAGRYTAGYGMPESLSTYIATKDGNWSEQIWQKYNVETKQAEGDLMTLSSSSGCAIIINANVTLDTANIKLSSLAINAGKTLNVGETKNNQVGYISGTGTLKVESGDAIPSGVYDDFLEVGGGTIEYGGTNDYNVFISSVYANNVIFSGSGKRNLRSDKDIQINGNMTINGPEVVFNGKDLTLFGNLTIESGHTSGTGSLVFAGTLQQTVSSTSDITLTGVELNNANGVRSNCGLNVTKLKLTKGVLTLDNGKSVVVTSASESAVEGGSSSSYVDGIMKRKLNSGTEYKFPVGDGTRYGEAGVLPSISGDWTVEYVNNTPTNSESRDKNVTALGSEYWKVEGADGNSARVRVRWDVRSGTFTTTSKMATYDGSKWTLIECNSPVGQTMLAVSAVTKVGGGPRLYTLATSSVASGFTWTGAESDDWASTGNWSGNVVPSPSDNVTIPAGLSKYPVITGMAYCNDLTIASGASLTLENIGYFAVEGTITNNGEMTLYYDFLSNSSFVYKKAMSGNRINVVRHLIPGKLTYTGSATKECTVSGLDQDSDRMRYMSSSTSYADGDKGSFSGIGKGNDVLAVNIDGTARMIEQSGTLVRADQTITVSLNEGWNFVSNPYPYNVNMDVLIASNEDIDPSVWVRTFDFSSRKYCWITRSTDLKTETGIESISTVAPFQGIHVYAKASTTLTFNPSALSNSVGTSLKSVQTEIPATDELRLAVEGNEANSYIDEAVLVFRDGGSLDIIRGDAKKYNYGVTYSSIAVAKQSQSMTIAYLPDATEMEELEIPLVVTKSVNTTSLTIYTSSIGSFDVRYDVMLVDKKYGVSVNLREEDYEVTDVDDMEDRFVVVLRKVGTAPEISTDIDREQNGELNIYATGNTIVVESDEKVLGTMITIYDIAGSVIARQTIESRVERINVGHRGVYIVNVGDVNNKLFVE